MRSFWVVVGGALLSATCAGAPDPPPQPDTGVVADYGLLIEQPVVAPSRLSNSLLQSPKGLLQGREHRPGASRPWDGRDRSGVVPRAGVI